MKVQATSNNQAIVEAWMLSIGGLGSIAVNSADAEVTSNADTEALVLANSTVSAPAGAVQVLATSTNTANASGLSVSGGLALAVNVMLITATVAGGTKASFDGTIPTTGTKTASLLVQTRGRNQAITDTDIASVSVGLSGTAVSADAQVTSGADTEAFVGSNASVNVSGGVTIDAQLTTDGGNGKQNYALAGISGGSVGGISAGVVLSNGARRRLGDGEAERRGDELRARSRSTPTARWRPTPTRPSSGSAPCRSAEARRTPRSRATRSRAGTAARRARTACSR